MSKEVHRIYFCKDGAILDTQIREGEDVTDTLKRCFKKISDLEAKLAKNKKWLASNEGFLENQKLKQQLAEKDHTINTLIEDHKASQEWYKMQIADTEAQNKRVLEKLDIIVRSNQELEKQHDIDNQVIQLMEDNREKDKISFAVEKLVDVQKYITDNALGVEEECFGREINDFIDNQIKQLKEMK